MSVGLADAARVGNGQQVVFHRWVGERSPHLCQCSLAANEAAKGEGQIVGRFRPALAGNQRRKAIKGWLLPFRGW